MSRLFLVRHGPTHAKSMVGWSDLPADLSDTAAIARLAQHLPEDALVISSDLIRAVHTADAIQNGRDRLPHDPDLREIHFGEWELKRWVEVNDSDPDHVRAFWETPGDVAAPGGESWNAVVARVSGAVDRLMKTHQDRDLVIVAHFGAILTQIARAEGMSGAQAFGHKIDNLSVSTIRTQPDWGAEVINQVL
ncbi:histidine phosphatase family protein [Shimia thalassica]|uniref:histidine phosphatase family protein n=1 Tax=Shimia thalassica TaxID=1715693 RepID=UPI001C097E40|nr:histidine phosphatase family protein [Shimia thalassica]MBU2943738.1 histidine phosphatase family protein [Shimia thalassica]MDO6501809.1 histidine phosphatase family protein [Shimia thalassica]